MAGLAVEQWQDWLWNNGRTGCGTMAGLAVEQWQDWLWNNGRTGCETVAGLAVEQWQDWLWNNGRTGCGTVFMATAGITPRSALLEADALPLGQMGRGRGGGGVCWRSVSTRMSAVATAGPPVVYRAPDFLFAGQCPSSPDLLHSHLVRPP